VIILIEVVLDRELEGLEIADHVVVVETIRADDQIHPAGMPVGESAPPGVLGEHVPVLDFEGFTDAIDHGRGL
jgi:hypothetical protein